MTHAEYQDMKIRQRFEAIMKDGPEEARTVLVTVVNALYRQPPGLALIGFQVLKDGTALILEEVNK